MRPERRVVLADERSVGVSAGAPGSRLQLAGEILAARAGRGWGNYFRTGNAERKFNQLDSYVYPRLTHWMNRRGGQRTGRAEKWSHERFAGMGLYPLRGTVKYPAHATTGKTIVKPCAGKLHARFERGS